MQQLSNKDYYFNDAGVNGFLRFKTGIFKKADLILIIPTIFYIFSRFVVGNFAGKATVVLSKSHLIIVEQKYL